ncbi:MAG: DUF4390 domain-containing protein [Curvibacter sp.]|nr:DUF4390 domain-containing protein [Curvibacter sp.]
MNRFLVSLAGWLLAACFLVLMAPARAQSPDIEVTRMHLERGDDGLFLSASLRFDLPSLVDDAAEKGIPLYFVAEAEVLQDRWYWYDKRVALASRYMRLAYQPLTRRWRLQVAPAPITNSGLGVSLGISFDDLSDALAYVQRIAHWKIAELGEVGGSGSYNVDFRFRLDVSQLPRPFQFGVTGRPDWNLSVSHNLRLGAAEAPK